MVPSVVDTGDCYLWDIFVQNMMESSFKLDVSLFLDHLLRKMLRTKILRRKEHIIFQYFHVGENIIAYRAI